MSSKKILLLIVSVVFLLITMHTPLLAVPPLPAKIGGTVTVDGTQLTQGTDTGYTFTVTKQDGTAYVPAAEDTDGLNTSDWYVIDIPIFDATDQLGGAQPGETAVIHVYLNGAELNVTSPSNREFRVGDSGTIEQIDITTYTGNPPSAPELIYPSNDETGLGTTVEFRWEPSTDPDGDTVTYDLYVCEDEGLTTNCITEENIASLENKGIYYAGIGGYGAGLLLFGIMLAGGVKGRIGRGRSGETGKRRWCEKRRTGLLIAMIMIAGLLLSSCGNGDRDDTTSITYTVSLSSNTQYYWAVVAEDSRGGETSSSVGSFTTR